MVENMFDDLSKVKFDRYLKKKGELKYLSWTVAYNDFIKRLKKVGVQENEIDIKIKNFTIIDKEGNKIEVPYIYDENTGYMVFTEIIVKDTKRSMWLPVMDQNNKAMKKEPYTYKVKEYKYMKPTGNYIEKTVDPATMTDINKAIMRCLVKNIAMFGLGLYIYNGEDLPVDSIDDTPEKISKEMEESIRTMIDTKQIPTNKVQEILKEYGYKKLADIEVDKVVKVRNDLARF